MLDKKEHQLYLAIHTKYANSILPQIPYIIYSYLIHHPNHPIPQISLEELLEKISKTNHPLNQLIIKLLEEWLYRKRSKNRGFRKKYNSIPISYGTTKRI